jgi:predicted transcriptional regulator
MTQYNGLLVTVSEDNPVVAIWSKPHKKNEGISAYILYADGFNDTSVFDHILESIFRAIRSEGAPVLAIYTKNTDEIITNTLKTRGFSFENCGNFIKHTRFISNKIITPKEWEGFCKVFKKHTKRELNGTLQPYDTLNTTGIIIGNKSEFVDFFKFETCLYPTLIVPKGRKVAVIPIKPAFADELIENKKIQLPLEFEKQPAFLKMEKAYFKKLGSGYKLEKGDLILFYASGDVGAIIGAARATLSGNYTIEEIKFQFKQQGVLAETQLQEMSKNGKVHTITFDNFIPFCKNVPLGELRKLGLGKNNFQNTTETTSEMFLKVCALGGVYGE